MVFVYIYIKYICIYIYIHTYYYMHIYIYKLKKRLAPENAMQNTFLPRKTWFFFDFIMLVPDIIILLLPNLDDGTTGGLPFL